MTNWTASNVLAERALREKIRGSLHDWAELALAPQGQMPAAHHRLLIRELEGLAAGRWDRLMLLLPPGSAKSTYASQDNWTGTDFLVPAASEVVWAGAWGGWHAISFNCGDYISPAGDGSVTLRSASGDVTLRPAARGRVRVGSDTEPVGFVTALGRGSPEGVVAAPPGSDYRNLDGGVGSTLWLKRSGTGTSGWVSIA